MVFRFLLLSDEVDKFHRELLIDSDATFFDLCQTILSSVDYTKNQMSSFFVCRDNWEKETEITLVEMDSGTEYDNYVMDKTMLSELIEDEGQKLLFVFDYMTERAFFLELKECILGTTQESPVCISSEGAPPQQEVSFEPYEVSTSSVIIDEKFYGDEEFDAEDLDEEGFDYNEGADRSFDHELY